MLVIGIGSKKQISSKDINVEPDVDSPQKIHDQLKKATSSGDSFDVIICIEDDEIVATYTDGEEYDTSDSSAEDDDIDADIDFDSIKDIDTDEDGEDLQ